MVALATVEDLILDRELTEAEQARAARLLDQVSGRFRREARQTFTPAESTVRLRVVDRCVYLPECPVTEVWAVVSDDGRPVAYKRTPEGGQVLTLSFGGEFEIRPGVTVEPPGGARVPGFVTVTYAHGGEVPEPVRDAVAAAVVRVMSIDSDAVQGATQVTDTRGPFSRTRQFAAWAVGGQALLSPDDVALARSYRPRAPRLWVMRP